jgi:hypothetical protein
VVHRANTRNGLVGSTFCFSKTAMSTDSGDIPMTIATGPAVRSAPNCVSPAATALMLPPVDL